MNRKQFEAIESTINKIAVEASAMRKTEDLAARALRKKHMALAQEGGYVMTGHISGGNRNYSFEHSAYLHDASKRKVKALLALDGFDEPKRSEFSGAFAGSRLFLAADGRWISITRAGSWSQWQSTDLWQCGDAEWDDGKKRENCGGSVNIMTDDEVAQKYRLKDIMEGLGKSLADLALKLPERLQSVRKRAELASQLMEALAERNKK